MSINIRRTSEQAELARAAGVNMIAIGVAEDLRQIFRYAVIHPLLSIYDVGVT